MRHAQTEGTRRVTDEQQHTNDRMWSNVAAVADYANRDLRPVEVVLLVRHRDALSGRVLELGCGAGRVTGYLAEIAAEVHAMDFSPAMVEACARAYPKVSVAPGDIRDMAGYAAASFDAIVAPFNVVDVLDDADRERLFDELRRIVRPGGLVVFSSHNRAVRPAGIARTLRDAGLLRAAYRARRLSVWLRNRRRARAFEREEREYAIRNDVGYEFGALHYYVTRDVQERQLARHGLTLVECLDLDGRVVPQGDEAAHSSELHYVARPA